MPFSGFDFMNVLTAAHAEHQALAPESLSRVYSVFAAKGGVGKTTIAFNLAVAARQQGYNVALVDGSLQFADLRALLRALTCARCCASPTARLRCSSCPPTASPRPISRR